MKRLKDLWELFAVFFAAGAVTVGGGLAMLPFVTEFAVEKKRWLTREEMTDCVAVAQTLPGVVILNIATYIGKKRSGFAGTAAAAAGVITPPFVIMILVTLGLRQIGENPYVTGAFDGAKSAAAALVVVACARLGKGVVKRSYDVALAAGAFAAVVFFGLSPLIPIAVGVALGLLAYAVRRFGKAGA